MINASIKGYTDIVRELVHAGANLHEKDKVRYRYWIEKDIGVMMIAETALMMAVGAQCGSSS